MTGSPRLVQLAGSVLYSPLLIGGLVGGVVSDRFDRKRTVQLQLVSLVPVTVFIGQLVRSGRAEVWMVYLFMFIVGIGWVTDMTSRRALVFDIVGPEHLDRAMAMESVSLSTGMAVGALVGGSAVSAVGIGASYFVLAAFMGLALALLTIVKPRPRAVSAVGISARSSVRDLVDGVRLLRANRGVVGILGVTAIANLFLFAYFPIVPVIAKRLDASAFKVGLLLAGTGLGMLAGSLVFARFAPKRRGLHYVLGTAFAMALVVPFALGRNYWIVLVSILASGVGSGVFRFGSRGVGSCGGTRGTSRSGARVAFDGDRCASRRDVCAGRTRRAIRRFDCASDECVRWCGGSRALGTEPFRGSADDGIAPSSP